MVRVEIAGAPLTVSLARILAAHAGHGVVGIERRGVGVLVDLALHALGLLRVAGLVAGTVGAFALAVTGAFRLLVGIGVGVVVVFLRLVVVVLAQVQVGNQFSGQPREAGLVAGAVGELGQLVAAFFLDPLAQPVDHLAGFLGRCLAGQLFAYQQADHLRQHGVARIRDIGIAAGTAAFD